MKQLNLLQRIQQRFEELSKGHKTLAEYITAHYDRAAFLTASRLGEIVGLSESTVVRFAYALDYNGYPELQRAIQDMVKSKLNTVERLNLSQDYLSDDNSVLHKVMQTDMDNLRITLEEVSEDAFNEAVDAIAKAGKIYIIGLRSATALSNFLGYYLNFILGNVHIVYPGLTDTVEQLLPAQKGDVVIGISFPRYTRTTVEAFEFAHRRGVKTIAITDSVVSPMGQAADITLVAKSYMASFIDSFVAPMSLVNALIVAVSMREKAKTERALAVLEQVWEDYPVFVTKEKPDYS